MRHRLLGDRESTCVCVLRPLAVGMDGEGEEQSSLMAIIHASNRLSKSLTDIKVTRGAKANSEMNHRQQSLMATMKSSKEATWSG